jgi:hypothetical protein
MSLVRTMLFSVIIRFLTMLDVLGTTNKNPHLSMAPRANAGSKSKQSLFKAAISAIIPEDVTRRRYSRGGLAFYLNPPLSLSPTQNPG